MSYPEFSSLNAPATQGHIGHPSPRPLNPSPRFPAPQTINKQYQSQNSSSTVLPNPNFNIASQPYQVYPTSSKQSYSSTEPVGIRQSSMNTGCIPQGQGNYYSSPGVSINVEHPTPTISTSGMNWNAPPSVSVCRPGTQRPSVSSNLNQTMPMRPPNNTAQWPQPFVVATATANASHPAQPYPGYWGIAPTFQHIGQSPTRPYQYPTQTQQHVTPQTNSPYYKLPHKVQVSQQSPLPLQTNRSQYMPNVTQPSVQTYVYAGSQPATTSVHPYYADPRQSTQMQNPLQVQQTTQAQVSMHNQGLIRAQQPIYNYAPMHTQGLVPNQVLMQTQQPICSQAPMSTQLPMYTQISNRPQQPGNIVVVPTVPQQLAQPQNSSNPEQSSTQMQPARTINKMPWMETPMAYIVPKPVKSQPAEQTLMEVSTLRPDTMKSVSNQPISPQVLTEVYVVQIV